MGIRGRGLTQLVLALVVGGMLALGPVATARAEDEPSTSTSEPTSTTTTVPPPGEATGPGSTTPPAVPTIPEHPSGELSAFDPSQTVAAEAELATLTATERALLRQLQSAQEALAMRRFVLVALARQVAAAQERLEAARVAERDARVRVEETTAQLERLKSQIVRLAADAYRRHMDTWALGAIGSVDVDNASALVRARTYARSDASFLNVRVEALTALRRRLEAERRTAEAARADAEAIAAQLDAHLAEQRAAYEQASEATTRAQSAVRRAVRADLGLVASMLDPKFGTDTIAAVLAFAQAGQSGPWALDGVFALPVAGAHLSSSFGLRIDPFSGTVAFHAGLDFGAADRTPIHAAADGMVVVAGDCGGYGSCVVIDHGASLATLYGHQSQVLVRVGDRVGKGQVIGLVGSTGISTGPHLHFEVRLRGAPIDPVPTLHA